MAENESLLGKSGGAIQAWFRTLILMFRDRRALLMDAPVRSDPPLSPVAFMVGGAAAFGVVHAIIGLQSPPMELPGAVSLLQQAVSALGKNVESLLCLAAAGIATALTWAAFRLFRLHLTWKAAMRHAFYSAGAQNIMLLLMVLPDLVTRFTSRLAPVGVFQFVTLAWLLSYLLLTNWTFRQYLDECRARVWRALPPFLLSGLPFWTLLVLSFDAGPDLWLDKVLGMAPGVERADVVHVDRWVLAARDPRPGEVVTIYPKNARRPWTPLGGAFRTVLQPLAIRVIAVPGDTVAVQGADLVVNGENLPREALRTRLHEAVKGELHFRQRIGERSYVLTYGPLQAPESCVKATPLELPAGSFFVAFDQRYDGTPFCGMVPRSRLSGLVDWNLRSKAAP